MSKGKNDFLSLLGFLFSQDLFMKITNNVKILFFHNKCPWSYKKFLQYNIPSVLDENKELYLSMRHVNFT